MGWTDEKIADIMMDGCNMGIKSVSRYMNEYSGASKETMDIANNVITLDEPLSKTFNIAKVPINDTGIVTQGISVAFKSPKKR